MSISSARRRCRRVKPIWAGSHLADDDHVWTDRRNWDQYIDAFSDGLPNGLDLFWYSSTKYPRSIPITPFKDYIRANQIDTDYYYNATPGSSQRDIKCAMRVRMAVRKLAEVHATTAPDQFAAPWREALVSVQNDLGSPGFGPVASNDTTNADRHRQAFVDARWAKGSRMPNIDGGHYFLTTMIPVKLEPVRRVTAVSPCPVTFCGRRWPACPPRNRATSSVAAGFDQPFFALHAHAFRSRRGDRPADVQWPRRGRCVEAGAAQGQFAGATAGRQSVPAVSDVQRDLDARPAEADGGLASWAEGLWAKAELELRAIFEPCVGFDAVDGGAAFAAWLKRCQIETTMSFNDYDAPGPDRQGYTLRQVAISIAVGAGLLTLGAGGN